MSQSTVETPKDAARRLSASAVRDGYKPQALHEYTASDGTPLYYRIRLKHPETGKKWIRPMKLNGVGYVLGEPEFSSGKPLYRLHDLARRPDEPLFVVEGEPCADVLAKLGVLATTSGAADSASKADWQPCAGRTAFIWPDNDEAGKRYGGSGGGNIERASLYGSNCRCGRVKPIAQGRRGRLARDSSWRHCSRSRRSTNDYRRT